MQAAGTNFQDIKEMDLLDDDSDKDRLKDGEEDANHNGWLDFNETDPTVADTDGDGIEDGLEKTLDRDNDGIADFEIHQLKNGEKCSPPGDAHDLDCDGIANGRDDDSDDDGCLDSEEGKNDKNENDIPDVWETAAKSCAVVTSGSSGSSGPVGGFSGNTGPAPSEDEGPLPPAEALPSRGGGACQLLKNQGGHSNLALGISIASLLVILGFLRMSSRSR